MLQKDMIKYVPVLCVFVCACGSLKPIVPKATSVQADYGVEWKFKAGEGADSAWYRPDYVDGHWMKVVSDRTLKEQKVALDRSFGWYRKRIVFPASVRAAIKKAGAVMLGLGKFAACEEVYVNGKLIGKTGEFPDNYAGYNDHVRRYYVDVEDLHLQGTNTIAIKFHDGWSHNGGFLDGAKLTVSPASTLDKLDLRVAVADEDYIFQGQDSIAVRPHIVNRNRTPVKGQLVVRLQTDDYRFVREDRVEVAVPARSTFATKSFGLKDVKPGFYRYEVSFKLSDTDSLNKKLNVGYEPEKIVSPNDAPADFEAFWTSSLQELAGVAPDYQLTRIAAESTSDYDLYEVTMRSLENELIRGYYAKPRKEGVHPVIVEYMGYGSAPYFPNRTWDGFAYFVLSVRGQALNKPTNRFGTWFTYGMAHPKSYYYRGAFMDVVRALDFVSSRPEIDGQRIAVRGSSQGGALSVAAASLDSRVKALAVGIPFLSDYRDYFQICGWPRSDVETYLKEHEQVTWDQVYNTLSYFDIKNLASRIAAPLVMGIGVQDDVCPPHINFAFYNQVRSPKRWMAFADYGHSTGKAFHDVGMTLFRKQFNMTAP